MKKIRKAIAKKFKNWKTTTSKETATQDTVSPVNKKIIKIESKLPRLYTVSLVNKKIIKIESKLPRLYCEIKKYLQFTPCVAV